VRCHFSNEADYNKAPGPDDFATEFCYVFWSLVKDDPMAVFRDFHSSKLLLCFLNFGIITLLPKDKKVQKIQQYRPICMINNDC
jgi:hypothetical protein